MSVVAVADAVAVVWLWLVFVLVVVLCGGVLCDVPLRRCVVLCRVVSSSLSLVVVVVVCCGAVPLLVCGVKLFG